MPTRRQVRDATPKCPGKKHAQHGHIYCGKPLIWNHQHGAWTCPRHGWVNEPEHAEATAA